MRVLRRLIKIDDVCRVEICVQIQARLLRHAASQGAHSRARSTLRDSQSVSSLFYVVVFFFFFFLVIRLPARIVQLKVKPPNIHDSICRFAPQLNCAKLSSCGGASGRVGRHAGVP